MQKRIVISLGIVIVFLLLVLMLIGCNKQNYFKIYDNSIGIIEKNMVVDNVHIRYFNKKLKEIGRVKFREKSLGSVECKTKIYKNLIYGISTEYKKKSAISKVVAINNDTGRYNIYRSDGYINDITADKDVYIINSFYQDKNISYINKLSKNLKEKTRLKISNIVLTSIYVSKKYLYATGFNYNNEEIYSRIYIIRKSDMVIVKDLDISDYIIDVSDMIEIDNKIYIGGRTRRDGKKQEVDSMYLTVIDVNTYETDKIYTGDKVGDLIYREGILYFSNYDNVLDEGNRLYSLEISTGKINKYEFDQQIRDIHIYKGKLYLLGKKKVYMYEDLGKILKVKDDNVNTEYVGFLRN